jgi:hypothetical protein
VDEGEPVEAYTGGGEAAYQQYWQEASAENEAVVATDGSKALSDGLQW